MIKLRQATLNDLEILERWDQNPHVIESDPNDDWNWASELARNPPWREQLVAELHGLPVGFIQIIDPALEETKYWGPIENDLRAIDIWIGEERHLGKGYGTQIMKLAIARCFGQPNVKAIVIDPLYQNKRARKFYERLGFDFVEKRNFGVDECAVYQLTRAKWTTKS